MGLNGGAVFASVEDSVATIATRTILASGTAKRTAGEAGTQIGFNVTYGPNIVLGGEVDLGWSNSRPRFQAPDGTFRIDDKFEAISTWRGRVGFALDNWLFYGTGGGAWTDGRAARTQLVPVAGGGGVLTPRATAVSAGQPAAASKSASRATGRSARNTSISPSTR